jgi:predicted membrane chloride channel (bestrophin family)
MVTWVCLRFGISYNVDLIIFSIAIIFPLVFTIREAFRRRQNAIKLLSTLKASISAFYFSLENSNKLSMEEKLQVHEMMNRLSQTFIEGLKHKENGSISEVRNQIRQIYVFVDTNRDSISGKSSLNLIRLIQDIQESIENLNGIKIHGTPISLRAYCLIFIYILPFIFTPTLVFNLTNHAQWLVYALSVLHGFILMSLYNLQDHIEDPFDQFGLDDI